MPDHEDSSLISLPDCSLANTAAGARRILSAMVGETLALTEQDNQPANPKHHAEREAYYAMLRAVPVSTWAEMPAMTSTPSIAREESVKPKPVKSESDEEETDMDDLKAGDVMDVAGQKLTVLNVDEDGNVTMEDGSRFGIQEVKDGDVIYGELEPLPSKPPPQRNFLREELQKLHQKGTLTTKGKVALARLNRAARVRDRPSDPKR